MESSVNADGDGLALCQPTRPLSPAIRAAQRCIEENYAETLGLVQLAALSGLSMHRFATAFREQVGMPPHRYQCHLRLRRARELLREGIPPADIAAELGFFDQSHLSRHFKRRYGVTPANFAGYRRRRIGFTAPPATSPSAHTTSC